ncbi:unnamed protein product [Effrenium voratum]|nr:unnamed protein product [Effrenium voratum]
MEWEEEVSLAPDGYAAFKVRIRELPMADGVHASTGCQLWSSSVVLAREIMARPYLVEKKAVLEVGAGCGLLGISVARLARQMLITDGDEEVVRNLSHNLEINRSLWKAAGPSLQDVSCRVLRWEELLEKPWPEEPLEVIVASDIIYGNWGETVAEALCSVLAPGGLVLLACSEDRRGGVRGFQERMEQRGFNILETKLRLQPLGAFRLYECRDGPLERRSLDLPKDRDEILDPGTVCKAAAVRPAQAVLKPKPVEKARPCWRVVGGRMQGGIIVRRAPQGVDKADYAGRLKHGALVQELERTKQRLLYSKLAGDGPDGGWVSFVSAKGAVLLRREEVTAIEVDVAMGYFTGNPGKKMPVMTHPPLLTSDLTFEDFLDKLIEDKRRHVKFDFKDLESVERCLPVLAERSSELARNGQAVWLNADVLPGPGLRRWSCAVPAEEFLSKAEEYCPGAHLSLGWKANPVGLEAYNEADCKAMAQICRHHAKQNVVFAVAARAAARDFQPLADLLAQIPGSQLLFWTGAWEPPLLNTNIYYDSFTAQPGELGYDGLRSTCRQRSDTEPQSPGFAFGTGGECSAPRRGRSAEGPYQGSQRFKTSMDGFRIRMLGLPKFQGQLGDK